MRILLSLGLQNRDESICQALVEVSDDMTTEELNEFTVQYFNRILKYDWEVINNG